MLIRRFGQHLRNQDWFTICVEFVIVVVGIFAGLQADQWNQARKDRILERQYLAALNTDFQADIAELDAALDLAESRAQMGRLISSAIEMGRVEGDPNEFIWAVYCIDLMNFPAYNRATISDLLSTGNLQLIRDTALKAAIADYYSDIEYREQWMPNWRDMQIALEHTLPDLLDFEIREAGHLRYAGGPDWIDTPFDFDADTAAEVLQRIIDHPDARGQIENMTRIQDTLVVNLNEIRKRAVAIEGALELPG